MSTPKEENNTKQSTTTNNNNNNNNDNSHINIDKLDIAVTEKSKVDFAKDKNYQYYPDKPDGNINKLKFAVKGASQFYDPCEESSKMSFKCLELNDYDKDMCRQYFDAYRECKKQWLSHRRSNGGQWK